MNTDIASNNNAKRLAKNTMFMYIRMAIVLIISLYTSRALLRALGVDDYGIYNLVGSIIGLLQMLRTMFAAATQRFLNFDMGRNNQERLNLIFNMSCLINMIVSLVFFIAIEAIGIWFFEYKINIDPSRLFAAKVVFHLSVFSAIVMIMTSSYDALVIAHERMGFYAVISVMQSVLNLGFIFALPLMKGDLLIIYGLMALMTSLVVRAISTIYCRKCFEECKYRRCWDKHVFKDMMAFSGWQMFGNTAMALTQNGLNMVFNVFGGPIVNAARGIAYQISSAVGQFINNIFVSITPYSIKAYSSGNKDGMLNMLFFSSKVLSSISFCIAIPICFLTYPILRLWLGFVPDYTAIFVQLILIWSAFRSIHNPLDTIFKATDDIKWYQIIEGIILSTPLIASYFILKAIGSVVFAFATMILSEAIDILIILQLAKKQVGLNLKEYYIQVLLPFYFCLFIGFLGYYLVYNKEGGLLLSFALSILVDAILITYMYLGVFVEREREYVKNLVSTKISPKRNKL